MLATTTRPTLDKTLARGTRFSHRHSQWAESVIGGDGLRFVPEIRCLRWGQECDLSMRLPSQSRALPKFDGQTITWEDTRQQIGFRAFALDYADFEHGGLEFEFVLFAPPKRPTLNLSIESNGLDLFWQPELSPVEVARGNQRPDNVLYSIAAYHRSRQPFHFEPGAADKYVNCKALHIFRPKAIDAKGNEHWVDWHIDRDASEFVFVYDDWFRFAAYPVVIDPTIGYTDTPGSMDGTNQYYLTTKFTAPEAGDANPGTARIYCSANSGTVTMRVGVYTDGGADPDGKARDAQSSDITATTTPGPQTAAITWTGITATSYWLSAASSFNGNVYYDNSTGTIFYGALVSGGTPPATHSAPEGSFGGRIGASVDYASGGGLSIPVAMNQYRQRWR